jgi:hypothetical protein
MAAVAFTYSPPGLTAAFELGSEAGNMRDTYSKVVRFTWKVDARAGTSDTV